MKATGAASLLNDPFCGQDLPYKGLIDTNRNGFLIHCLEQVYMKPAFFGSLAISSALFASEPEPLLKKANMYAAHESNQRKPFSLKKKGRARQPCASFVCALKGAKFDGKMKYMSQRLRDSLFIPFYCTAKFFYVAIFYYLLTTF